MAAVGVHDVRVTAAPGDEERLAARAAAEGIETIVALGGDGTWGNVARGILASGRDVRLALMAAGTGNDFGQALGLPVWDYHATARLAVSPDAMHVDMGCAGGIPFLNVAGAGIQTAVLERAREMRLLRGSLLYVAAALPLLRTYRAFTVRVGSDGANPTELSCLTVIVSNGPRYGGGFRIAPPASVTDGLLDLVTVVDTPVVRRLPLFLRARLGAHLGQREVRHGQVQASIWHFDAPPLLDIDGELRMAPSAVVEITCLPRVLRVAG